MSNIKTSIRLYGNLPGDAVIQEMVVVPFKIIRRGDKDIINHVVERDVLTISLAHWDNEQDLRHDDQQILATIAIINQLSNWLCSLDRSHITTEFYISTVRTLDQGGLSLPAALIGALSAANLSLAISITVVLDDESD